MTTRDFARLFAGAVLMAAAFVTFDQVASEQVATSDGPISIARQGSVEAGGRVVTCDTVDGENASNGRQKPGRMVVDQVYATFQYPAVQRYPYPILFNPGGGHTARIYDTTPDGREGWLTLFLREGFPTYGVDRLGTGRSGRDVCKINAARLGRAPASDIPVMSHYTFEAAWVNFRWGPKFGVPYADTQFPIDAAETYYRQTLMTYRDDSEAEKTVAALSALLDKTGPAILQTWSSSGLLGNLTAIARPEMVKGILAVEPSAAGLAELPADKLSTLARIPILIVVGDHAPERITVSRDFQKKMAALGGDVTVDVLPEAGIRGNGHTMALEKNNKQIMLRMIAWMESHVFNKQAAGK
jgi:pimeloyl-ACP methyl ester carboxylesterase